VAFQIWSGKAWKSHCKAKFTVGQDRLTFTFGIQIIPILCRETLYSLCRIC
jgi:hypothetical protein